MSDQPTVVVDPAADGELAAARARREALVAEHGQPSRYDTQKALGALGLLDQINPVDACAFLHATREGMDAFAKENREHYGHPTWMLAVPGEGYVGVLDLRPWLQSQGVALAKPKGSRA